MRMHVSLMLEHNNHFEKDHFGNPSEVTKAENRLKSNGSPLFIFAKSISIVRKGLIAPNYLSLRWETKCQISSINKIFF